MLKYGIKTHNPNKNTPTLFLSIFVIKIILFFVQHKLLDSLHNEKIYLKIKIDFL